MLPFSHKVHSSGCNVCKYSPWRSVLELNGDALFWMRPCSHLREERKHLFLVATPKIFKAAVFFKQDDQGATNRYNQRKHFWALKFRQGGHLVFNITLRAEVLKKNIIFILVFLNFCFLGLIYAKRKLPLEVLNDWKIALCNIRVYISLICFKFHASTLCTFS